jgi:hypothetical protein
MHKNYGWGHSSHQPLIWQTTQNHIFQNATSYYPTSYLEKKKKKGAWLLESHSFYSLVSFTTP